MKRIFVKVNKNNSVAEIYWAENKRVLNPVTPVELKPTLNMFKGQQFPECFRSLLTYAEVSLAAQEGDIEAQKKLDRIHYELNH